MIDYEVERDGSLSIRSEYPKIVIIPSQGNRYDRIIKEIKKGRSTITEFVSEAKTNARQQIRAAYFDFPQRGSDQRAEMLRDNALNEIKNAPNENTVINKFRSDLNALKSSFEP